MWQSRFMGTNDSGPGRGKKSLSHTMLR